MTSLIVVGVIAFVVGILVDRVSIAVVSSGDLGSARNPIPPDGEKQSVSPPLLMDFRMEEWKEIVATQRHFNDLIIRFRATTLTAFAALAGAAVTLAEVIELQEANLVIVMALPIAFWLAAAALDLGYYHRLLLGAVAEATKFDNHESFKSQGFFGLTEGRQGPRRTVHRPSPGSTVLPGGVWTCVWTPG